MFSSLVNQPYRIGKYYLIISRIQQHNVYIQMMNYKISILLMLIYIGYKYLHLDNIHSNIKYNYLSYRIIDILIIYLGIVYTHFLATYSQANNLHKLKYYCKSNNHKDRCNKGHYLYCYPNNNQISRHYKN